MVDLFYFLSSLPMLLWGHKPQMSCDELLDQVNELLGNDASTRLRRLSLIPCGNTSSIGKTWEEFDTFLRNELGKVRATRLRRGRDGFQEHPTPISSPMTEHRLQEILQVTSPEERELQLDKLRWDFLDSLTINHSQDFQALEIYALKLQLLNKIHTRELSKGQELFNQIIQEGCQQANSVRTLI